MNDAWRPDGTELDFWIGEWDATWGEAGRGTNRISRILADKVVFEEFDGRGNQDRLVGRSWSVYDPDRGLWRQTWVDDDGSYLALEGGMRDGAMELATTDGAHLMRFEDITPDAFAWSWSRLDGDGWETVWEIAYTRAASTAGSSSDSAVTSASSTIPG
jgi:hypothetical protein